MDVVHRRVRGIDDGALFGSRRYRILDAESPDGFFLRQPCEVFTDSFVPDADDERFVVEAKAVHYGRYAETRGETFEQHVARRRRELAREAQMLALYKRTSPRIPQLIEKLVGANTWSERVVREGLEKQEIVLLIEGLPGKPLVEERADWSVEEALELANGVLTAMRTFQEFDRRQGARYFLPLTPLDVLVDRRSRTCWLQNLGALWTSAELSSQRIFCERADEVFVSPAIAHLLQRDRPPPPPPPALANCTLPRAALHGVAAVLAFVLDPERDFTALPLGWLDRARMDDLLRRRDASREASEFLCRLASHDFADANAALAELARVRDRVPSSFVSFDAPIARTSGAAGSVAVAPGSAVGRYRIAGPLTQGGRGSLFLADDPETGRRVLLKVPHYPEAKEALEQLAAGAIDDAQAQRRVGTAVIDRRDEALAEARNALRVRKRTNSVPQLLDVVAYKSELAYIRGHAGAAVSGGHEPVLVFELVPGYPVSTDQHWTQVQLLELARSLCTVLERLHKVIDGCFFLYMDWKPQNVVRHPEHDGYTLVDLGAVVKIAGDAAQDPLYFSEPYGALELYDFGAARAGVLNRCLTGQYDLYGLAAVLWTLAARPDSKKIGELIELRQRLIAARKLERVFQPGDVGNEYAELRPILTRALEAAPAQRYASATEMLREVERALGRLTPLLPEPPRALSGKPVRAGKVEVNVRLGTDRLCERLIVTASPASISDHSAPPIEDCDITGKAPGAEFQVMHDLPPALANVHYAAFTRGFNGKRSGLRKCSVAVVTDPEEFEAERLERGLELHWRIPEAVRGMGGEVVVERAGRAQPIYVGRGEHCVDRDLDPARKYEYHAFCRALGVSSDGEARVEAQPLPTLARVESIAAEPGDGEVRVSFVISRAAATHIQIVRSLRPLETADLRDSSELALRPGLPPIECELDGQFRLEPSRRGAALELWLRDGGRMQAAWIDRDVIPGTRYCYSIVLWYRARDTKDVYRLGLWAESAAFAEVGSLAADALLGGVRLSWKSPARATAIRVERTSPSAHTELLPPDAAAFLDRGLAPSVEHSYKLCAVFGDVISAGHSIAATPHAPATSGPSRALSRLIAVPQARHARLWVDFDGLSNRARVERRDAAHTHVIATVGTPMPVNVAVHPWERVELALFDTEPDALERVSVTAFDEPHAVGAGRGSRVRSARFAFQPPAQCDGVLVELTSAPQQAVCAADACDPEFLELSPGAHRARAHALKQGVISDGSAADPVAVLEPA